MALTDSRKNCPDALNAKGDDSRVKQVPKKTLVITLVCFLAMTVLLSCFPVHRLSLLRGISDYYNVSEKAMLASKGSSRDRIIAQDILNRAEAAFADYSHTDEENKKTYGILSRYATSSSYKAATAAYSLELLSAHLGTSEGYVWVFYTSEAFDAQGNTVRGSWNIPSLWKVEKDASGTWNVVSIREHP